MSGPPLRFIHAGDFHLEQTPHGIADIPVQIRDTLVDAAFNAVEKVFDAVLAEEAQALLLSGDVLDVDDIGPRSLLFLVQQFERLADRDIPIYWAPGPTDPSEKWLTASMFPENVHRFSGNNTEYVFQHSDLPTVRLIGGPVRSSVRAKDFDYQDDGMLTVVVAYGQCDQAELARQPVDYWALGGFHQRQTINKAPPIHYSGSPQGRCPTESGPHGCTLVEIDSDRQTVMTPLVTDVLRWHSEHLAINAPTDVHALEQHLQDHLQSLIANSSAQHLLVSWLLTGPAKGTVCDETTTKQVVEKLRAEFGCQSPCAWTTTIELAPPTSYPPEWYDEESMRGEFLRNVQNMQHDDAEPLDLEALLPLGPQKETLLPIAHIAEPLSRSDTLRHAAAIGAQMVGSEED
ncbi:MAG: DNA repair exonuclease [Planctomycetales bacterium]